ncbi:glycosyltransferase [Longitalea luteola]|uniref:glycosyltransferase n=1 Tax=Longitalea luteola TaxID=2812563 RepID=UPI001A978F56|nr:glycosyltransferase [Longitalea luteola]
MVDPKVSFCISTYNRPVLLKKQLQLLATQTYAQFEVVVSDNDPTKSAESVVTGMNDPRFRYFANDTNLGMVKSFNKSIERSKGEYVIMVTDDDPVIPTMIEEMLAVATAYPSYPVYCGCNRPGKEAGAIETFGPDDFLFQLLHPVLTPHFLWSSCLLKREIAYKVGGMPDFGSPHLADHALLALCSEFGGGVFINKVFSNLYAHDSNFSKSNFELYYIGCKEFYRLITEKFKQNVYQKNGVDALMKHLGGWFIANSFALRKYFTYNNKNSRFVEDVAKNSAKILELPFMQRFYPRYVFKLIIFYFKFPYNSWVRAFRSEKKYI